VCIHSNRKAIDAALVAGEAAAALSVRYRPLSTTAIKRHRDAHLPMKLAKAKDAKEVSQADDLLAQIGVIRSQAKMLTDKAEAEGDYKTALAGCRELRGCIELLAKLLGEIDERPVVNVHLNPQWLEIRTVIVSALQEHPQAAQDVTRALQSLEVQQ
jgi:hypothetical protein